MAKQATRMSGRPPGNDSTRAAILAHAREAFATTGYSGTSLRAIAASAEVDPSTVIHFFGTKDGLFQAVIKDGAAVTQPLLDAFRRQARGRELVTIYLGIWENDKAAAVMGAIIRTSLGSAEATALLKESLTRSMLDGLASAGALEAELVVMQLIGLGLGRYIAQLPELAGTDITTIAERVGPLLDHYLFPSP